MTEPNEFPAEVELRVNIRIGEETDELIARIPLPHILITSGEAGSAAATQLSTLGRAAERIINSKLALKRDTITEGVARKRVWGPVKTEITQEHIDEFIKATGFHATERDRK